MSDTPRAMRLGAATITVLNVGDSLWTLAELLPMASATSQPAAADLTQPALFPSQCVHIALPGASILVDASLYDFPPDSPQRPPNYAPPPDIGAQLEAIGVPAEAITHLVITHLHADHFDAASVERAGVWAPRFPNARCYIGRPDWEDAELQRDLRDPQSNVARTLGTLERSGHIELIDGDRDLLPEVRLIAAPGESPGHQLVRIASGGQTLYCLGDLYHHPLEVEHPEWMCEWCDVPAAIGSRQALAEHALAEHALLVAAHIAGAGRLERGANAVRWVEA